jgi:hypothetical protein
MNLPAVVVLIRSFPPAFLEPFLLPSCLREPPSNSQSTSDSTVDSGDGDIDLSI